MAKVLGVGGVFFKAKDPKALAAWYGRALQLDVDPTWGGCVFLPAAMPEHGATIWAPFAADTDYFAPSDQPFMFNLVVDDLAAALAQVEAAGGELHGEPVEEANGAFGWFVDPEGNKVELWQPKRADG